MSEKRIVVPEGMLEAAVGAICENGRTAMSTDLRWSGMNACLEAALRWLSENPIVPSYEDVLSACGVHPDSPEGYVPYAVIVCIELQKSMFLAPEPEVPEEIKDLWDSSPTPDTKRQTIEAFRRGQRSAHTESGGQ